MESIARTIENSVTLSIRVTCHVQPTRQMWAYYIKLLTLELQQATRQHTREVCPIRPKGCSDRQIFLLQTGNAANLCMKLDKSKISYRPTSYFKRSAPWIISCAPIHWYAPFSERFRRSWLPMLTGLVISCRLHSSFCVPLSNLKHVPLPRAHSGSWFKGVTKLRCIWPTDQSIRMYVTQ